MLWPSLFIPSGAMSSLFPGSFLDTYQSGGAHLPVLFISFCLFILFMGFSRQEYWSCLPFPSPVSHVLSELSTMTCPSRVTLHSMAHSFTELHEAVIHVIIFVSFL